jgi:hypothetical protein
MVCIRTSQNGYSDEEDFSLSGLTQNTFLADPVILDDELSIISSILETENLDFGNSESVQMQILVMPNQQMQEIYHLLATKSYRK